MRLTLWRASLLLLLFAVVNTTMAKDKKKKGNADTTAIAGAVKTDSLAAKSTPKKEVFKSIKEVTEKCKKIDGLFPLYQDTISGKLYLEISEDKIGNEFIYFAYVMDGIPELGFARGGYKDNSIFKIERYFDRVDFILQNTIFYFNPENNLSKAKDANINQPLFLSEKIAASNGKTILIEADNLFLSENITQVKPSKMPGERPDAFSLGALSSKKSKYLSINNYPNNTDVSVEYIYDNPQPTNYGPEEATDARFVSVKMQHSLIEVPNNNYKPRFDDPRVGYFIDKITDQTSTSATPWRDLIHRWDLQKKDPNAVLSEPVKPIVWWVEKTTPKEFQQVVKAAVEAWNEAFETAGFKNAVICHIQPDTATWEAEDIRYNVIRFTSSPKPPFGGYGPSFVNPRTGEILGADIMLEFVYMTNRLNIEKLYDVAALDHMKQTSDHGDHDCTAGETMQHNIQFGLQAMNAYGLSDLDKDKFIRQALFDLVLHEVGHTMGLSHNFIASQLHSYEKMQDTTIGKTIGLTASVMDYTIPNIAADKSKQGLYFDIKPGPYDKWAIQYGYIQGKDSADEQALLKKILAQSNLKEHRFMNDADDMRAPGRGIDPRANLYDMSDDAISYAVTNIKMANDIMPKLLEKYSKSGQSYHELRNAYLILTGNYSRSLNVITRYIGGVYVNRSFAGQDATTPPFTPVPLAEQKRAMLMLSTYGFSKNAFQIPEQLFAYLQMQRRGYDFRKEPEDPKIHERFLNIQRGIFDQLLHPNVLQRLTDSKLYGNQYELNTMMSDLTNAVFMDDLAGSVSTIRQNAQVEYVQRLLKIVDNKTYSYTSQSAAFGEIQRILSWMKAPSAGNSATKSHRALLAFTINKFMESK